MLTVLCVLPGIQPKHLGLPNDFSWLSVESSLTAELLWQKKTFNYMYVEAISKCFQLFITPSPSNNDELWN